MKTAARQLLGWFQQHIVVTFALGSVLVTGIFFAEIIFQGKTLLSVGTTAGVMGDAGPYKFLKTTKSSTTELWENFAVFHKDLGPMAWQEEPHNKKNFSTIAAGAWPLWNDDNAVGKPQAANFITTPFFPLKIVLYLLPNAIGWDIYLLLRFALGVFFCALFLREIKLRPLPSFLGGVMFAFSGYFILFQNITDMDVGLLTPIVFWAAAFTRTLARSTAVRWWQYGAVVLALASLLLANVPEPLLPVLATGALFWLALLIQSFFRDERSDFYRFFCLSVQILVPAGLIALPQYLLNYELVLHSISVGHPVEAQVGIQAWAYHYIFLYVVPFFHVDPYLLPLKPVSSQTFNYIGVGMFFLLVFGAVSGVIKRNAGLFLFLLLLLTVGKIYGLPGFLHHWIGEAPGFERVLYPKYIQPLVSFAAASLAAVGLNSLIIKTISKKDFWYGLLIILAIIWFGIVLLLPYASDVWIENFAEVFAKNRNLLFAHLGIFALLGYILIAKTTKPRLTVVVSAVLGIAVIAELFLFLPRDYPPRYDSFTEAPFVAMLQEQAEPFRIFGFDRILFPELSSAFGLDDIRTLDVLYIKQYYLYIKNFISPDIYDRFTGAEESGNEAEPVRYLNNPMFDLLNVKYILAKTPPLELFPENKINRAIFAINAPNPGLRETAFIQNGDGRRVFLEHAPGSACVTLPVTATASVLKFSTALDTPAWEHPGNDGVEFLITNSTGSQTFFQFTQNPAEQLEDRKWIDHAVDLAPLVGQNSPICFVTKEFKNNMLDISGWADLRLTSAADTTAAATNSQYKLIYDAEVEVFENTHAYPRAFLVGAVTTVGSDDEAVTAMQAADFDPRTRAIVTTKPDQPELPTLSGDTCAGDMANYDRPNPNNIRFTITSPGDCFLVFSESNYPGWIARVNGEKTPVYQTDLLLRGIALPPGEHTVEFLYRPKTFYGGLVGSVIGLALTGFWVVRYRRRFAKQSDKE